jgi:predicted transcriptional regulator
LNRKVGARFARCRKCNKKISITAGTIFERMRSARPYLVPMLLIERGISFNARQLHRLVGIAYSSAWEIFQKMMHVVSQVMIEKGIAVSSFDFNEVICKRSTETEARKHPSTEQEEVRMQLVERASKESIDHIIESKISLFLKPRTEAIPSGDTDSQETILIRSPNHDQGSPVCSTEKVIYKLLSSQPTSIDQLAAATGFETKVVSAGVTMLELAQLIKCVPAGLFVRSNEALVAALSPTPPDANVVSEVNRAIDFIRRHFHGVSRKYLQNYLAAYWCSVDRARWHNGALFKLCLRRVAGRSELKLYVSPPTVLLCAA